MTKDIGKSKTNLARAEKAIAERALGYPEVVEEAPWGHRAFKIRGKTFMFLSAEAGQLSFSLKLPVSGEDVLGLTFTEPTGYGLGKSGWVTSSFSADDEVPLLLVEAWVDESFRAIAPKKVVASLAPAVVSEKAAPKKAPLKNASSVSTVAKEKSTAAGKKPASPAKKPATKSKAAPAPRATEKGTPRSFAARKAAARKTSGS
jgi:predicted DNA-binding protein (MmcQ/YjbR family)